MNIVFRSFEMQDFAATQKMHACSFEQLATEHYTPNEMAVQIKMIQNPSYLDALCASNLSLAILNNEIVGTAGWCSHDSNTARIRKVFVSPKHAKHGLGRSLIHRVEGQIQEHGFSEIIIRASMNAVPFYERVGFSTVKPDIMRLENLDVPVMLMRKTLLK
jgi:putative acetyltransferase